MLQHENSHARRLTSQAKGLFVDFQERLPGNLQFSIFKPSMKTYFSYTKLIFPFPKVEEHRL